MAAGRWEWATASTAAAIGTAFGTPAPNPFRPAAPEPPKSAEQVEAESARSWRIVELYFEGGKGEVWQR